MKIAGGMIGKVRANVGKETNTARAKVIIDAENDLYLSDHKIGEKLVLPMAFAVNMIFEVARAVFFNNTIDSMSDFRVLGGVLVEHGQTLELIVEVNKSIDDFYVKVYSEVPKFRPHFSCQLSCAQFKASPNYRSASPAPSSGTVVCKNSIYEKLLFHGPIFQGVQVVQIEDPLTVVGTVKGISPLLLKKEFDGQSWFIDPVALDCCMQVAAVHTNMSLGLTVLPYGFSRFTLFDTLGQQTLCVKVQFLDQIARDSLTCSISAYDTFDQKIFCLENLEGLPAQSR